ncbi:MAG: DUF2141 domain-containing protein [Pseudomonadota bacterium]|nr:DUF2141 domain-containing protein [Pseudomonadota bacterium]
MKIKIYLFLILTLFFTSNVKAETLVVEIISEFKEGPILMAVYNEKKFFGKTKSNEKTNPDHVLVGAKGLIKDYKAKLEFNIPFGNYALAGIHDLDNNGMLSGNFLGIPKEPFGFSNNARGNFGPPKWEDCLITFDHENQIISINLKGL